MSGRIRRLAALTGLIMAGAAASSSAQGPRPLPDFQMLTLDGAALSAPDAAREGTWVLLYVQPNCRPCDALLGAIKADEHSAVASAVAVVVAGASPAQASAWRQRLPDLAQSSWYVDVERSGWGPLRLTGVPMIFGVRDGTIEWSLSGAMSADEKLVAVLASWVRQGEAPPQ